MEKIRVAARVLNFSKKKGILERGNSNKGIGNKSGGSSCKGWKSYTLYLYTFLNFSKKRDV